MLGWNRTRVSLPRTGGGRTGGGRTGKLEAVTRVGHSSLCPRKGYGSRRERVVRLLEAASVRLLCLGEGLEPLGDLFEPLFAGGLRHARIHRLVFVRLAGD